ncbi:hypothetical protein TNCT_360221 [Trichonephila clavata]|uniref:Uncharacterized protein n=1 Tax=Trichonephila clavata TaxID=2740835 RepID=A0A8X6F8J1_TRICU|nr:hypothetical protein TNCT_360221 [Trichonephila clavata]
MHSTECKTHTFLEIYPFREASSLLSKRKHKKHHLERKRGLSKIPLATFCRTKEIKKLFNRTLTCSVDDSLVPNSFPRPPFKESSLWPNFHEVDHPQPCSFDIRRNILRNRAKMESDSKWKKICFDHEK